MKAKESWSEGNKSLGVTDCSLDTTIDKKIYLSTGVWGVVLRLCKEIESEWQILLSGIEDEKSIQLNGYYVPKQEVTGATVTNKDCIDLDFVNKNQILATMHSHSNMGVFFSKTDEDYTNLSFIPYHIVVNNKHEIKACGQIKLPCGLIKLVDIPVVVMYNQAEVVGIENIVKKTHFITQHTSGHYYGNDYSKNISKKYEKEEFNFSEYEKKKHKDKHKKKYKRHAFETEDLLSYDGLSQYE